MAKLSKQISIILIEYILNNIIPKLEKQPYYTINDGGICRWLILASTGTKIDGLHKLLLLDIENVAYNHVKYVSGYAYWFNVYDLKSRKEVLKEYLRILKHDIEMNKEPKFVNKDGSLTYYAFKCGYVQKEISEQNYKRLYMEHDHFHLIYGEINGASISVTFEANELTKARKFYQKIKL